jgi:proteasome accessory factor B
MRRGRRKIVGGGRYNVGMGWTGARSTRSTAATAEGARAGSVVLFRGRGEYVARDILRAAQVAVAERRVVCLDYTDRLGGDSTRAVEPAGLVRGVDGWYLVGWCRLRGAGRSFRLDRIRSATLTADRVPQHEVRGLRPDVPAGWAVAPLAG